MVKFQSTHLHEVWQLSQSFGNFMLTFQSTHLHEVWRAEVITSVSLRCFNPHTYMRCDTGWWKLSIPNWPFQSTHLHEVWLRHSNGPRYELSFNPHTYMRCDNKLHNSLAGSRLFQSTHLHEVWHPPFALLSVWMSVSIHTPTWGVTYAPLYVSSRFEMFQSTHLHEVWQIDSWWCWFPY